MPSKFFRYDPQTDSVVEAQPASIKGIARYPLSIEAMAVAPSQIHEAREFDQSQGVPTDYRHDGTPIMRDAGHYRRYRRAHGVHFRNAYDD